MAVPTMGLPYARWCEAHDYDHMVCPVCGEHLPDTTDPKGAGHYQRHYAENHA